MPRKIVVGDSFRTNKLSLKPGGYTVTVVNFDGSSKIYTKVKNPEAYAKIVSENQSVKKIMTGNKVLFER